MTRSRRTARTLLASVVLALVSACGLSASACSSDTQYREGQGSPTASVEEVAPDRAALSVTVLSSAGTPVDVAVTVGGTVVLAATVPAALDDCPYEPLFEHHFDVAPGRTDITVVAGDEQVTVPAVIAADAQWLFVGLQSGFPPNVQLSANEPSIPS